MKCNEVLNLLKITRQTLCRYVKEGKIKVKELPSGRYDYENEKVIGDGFINLLDMSCVSQPILYNV